MHFPAPFPQALAASCCFAIQTYVRTYELTWRLLYLACVRRDRSLALLATRVAVYGRKMAISLCFHALDSFIKHARSPPASNNLKEAHGPPHPLRQFADLTAILSSAKNLGEVVVCIRRDLSGPSANVDRALERAHNLAVQNAAAPIAVSRIVSPERDQ